MVSDSGTTLELYKSLLRELLGKVIDAMEQGPPGPERVQRGLTAYWDASFERRELCRRVHAALGSTKAEAQAQRLAQPFYLIIRSELLTLRVADPDTVAEHIYRNARSIALREAQADQPDLAARSIFLKALNLRVGTVTEKSSG